jgi:ubiquinone/menaquinone biosynthesis C-methylase UbiE
MSDQFSYDQGVSGFDQTFGLPMRQFVPTLLRLARLVPGQRVLDIASGSGIAAEAALDIVGQSGHVAAADIEPSMLEEAKKRLSPYPNVSFAVEDGLALSFPDASFDAIVCCMALHIFPDRIRALSGFHRVLRGSGCVAVSVNTTAERSLTGYLRTVVARHVPSKKAEIAAWNAHMFSLGDADRLRRPFETVGFRDVETVMETWRFSFPSFDAYFDPIAEGAGPWGGEYTSLPADARERVSEDLRRELEGDEASGGAVEIDVDILFASGRK